MSANLNQEPAFANAGSQRWLQVAVNRAPEILKAALQASGAIAPDEQVHWKSPLASDRFCEYRDGAMLSALGIDALPNRSLADFWPSRGPVWDGLARTSGGKCLLVEAKAHIPEAASPATTATGESLERIKAALEEARRYYSPRAKAEWSKSLYQYANRLAFQYFLAHVNGLATRLIFLDFYNADDVRGPETIEEWRGATMLIHALLGLPSDLSKRGVFHVYVDARMVASKLAV